MTKFNLRLCLMRDFIGIFFVCILLFTWGLRYQDIIGFETRFYLFALEMWRNGFTWFPTTYGHYYPDYPVLPTFLIYLTAKTVGSLDKFAAVFPSAVAAAISVSTTYLIGALHSRRLGILAACFMLLTNIFVVEARTISPDQYVLLVTTLAFYCVYSSELLIKYKRLFFLPLLFLLGMACRGPIGFIVPAGVVSVFYILEKDPKKFFIFAILSFFTLVLGCAILFYIARMVGGDAFAQSVWDMQVANRLEDAWLPWYFYFSESVGAYAISYPLALLVLAGLGGSLFKKHLTIDARFIWKLFAWILVIMIGLSIPAGKKIRYILAITPAIALLSAMLFTIPIRNIYFNSLRLVVKFFCLFLPFFAAIVTLVAYVHLQQRQIPIPIFYVSAFCLFVFLQLLNFVVHKHDVKVIAVAAFSFVMIFILIIEPINLYLNRTRIFVTQVEFLRNTNHANLVFYHEDPDGLPIKYIANMRQAVQANFVYDVKGLKNLKGNNLVITSQEYFSELPPAIQKKVKILFKGNLGREPMVVFLDNQ